MYFDQYLFLYKFIDIKFLFDKKIFFCDHKYFYVITGPYSKLEIKIIKIFIYKSFLNRKFISKI